jgi:hypothetical protein
MRQQLGGDTWEEASGVRHPQEASGSHQGITQEPARRHPRGSQETPRRHPDDNQETPSRRHPGGTQEAPRRHPGGTQRHPAGTQEALRKHNLGVLLGVTVACPLHLTNGLTETELPLGNLARVSLRGNLIPPIRPTTFLNRNVLAQICCASPTTPRGKGNS